MKYRKKRLPVSKIRNLLTFICQALILAILGTLLAGPVIKTFKGGDENEAVIIVDASAGMRIKDSESTRFERALDRAKERAEKSFESGSRVSFIISDGSSDFLYRRVGAEDREALFSEIDAIREKADERCSYSSVDVSGAMSLAEEILDINSEARVYFYTCSDYTYSNGVKVENVSGKEEWNAAVHGVHAELDSDNHYEIKIDAACYGRTDFITVFCKVHGVNGDSSKTVSLERGEFFDPTSERKEIVFTSDDLSGEAIYSYEYVEAYVSVRDSLAEDNSYFLYGGKRPIVNIQYASSSPNNFIESAIRSLRENKKEIFDIRFTVLREGETPLTEGFDIYIFEHKMPEVLPTDGLVLLIDPRTAPIGSDLQIGSSYSIDSSSTLSGGVSHDITKYTSAERITIAKYNDILLSEGYEELMFYNGRPVMLLRDTPESKVLVWAFDLNYSNLIALPDFSILIYNTFGHFIKETFRGTSFEVGDEIALTGRWDSLTVYGAAEEYLYENAEGSFIPTRPGTYTVVQTASGGIEIPEESFFVSIPKDESDTERTFDALPLTQRDSVRTVEYSELVLYFAIALVTFMFAEWILEIKKNY